MEEEKTSYSNIASDAPETISLENKFDLNKAKEYITIASKSVEEFAKLLYGTAKTEGIAQATKLGYEEVSQKLVTLSSNINSQIIEKITKEKVISITKELQSKFQNSIQEIPSKLNETTNNAKEYASNQIKACVSFVENNGKEVVNNYGIPIISTITDGITDEAYNIDQKYHIVGKIGYAVQDIDSKLGIKEKTEQIDSYFGISTIVNNVLEKGKQIDEYLTGGIGTTIVNKGIEVGQHLVNYAKDEVTKVNEVSSIHNDNNDSTYDNNNINNNKNNNNNNNNINNNNINDNNINDNINDNKKSGFSNDKKKTDTSKDNKKSETIKDNKKSDIIQDSNDEEDSFDHLKEN